MFEDKNKIFFWVFLVLTFVICSTSLFMFERQFGGDAPTYIEALEFLKSGVMNAHVPYRILTTFLALESVLLFSWIFGSVDAGWLVMNTLFFFLFSAVFYRIVFIIFKSHRTAFLSGLFLATNYAMIMFGPAYWMDMGGWLFYGLSLLFTLRYSETSDRKFLLYSAAFIGAGGLFKEYAFLGVIPIASILFYENWPSVTGAIKKGIAPALIVLAPVTAIFVYVYNVFNYTYLSWFSINQDHFVQVYSSRINEYIKSLGSLYTFLAFAVIAGAYYFFREGKSIVPDKRARVFIISVCISALPIFAWPAITQRILFITVPAALLIASFCFKKFEKYWWCFLPLIAIYTLTNFTMDSYVLPNFDIPLQSIVGKTR